MTTSKRVALLDGDILVYESGFASDAGAKANGLAFEPLGFALHGLGKKIDAIIRRVEADDYMVILTGKRGDGTPPIREQVFPEYKKNRDPSHRPHWYKEITQHLVNKHPSMVVMDGLEADDWLAILNSRMEDSIICTKDKDLDQVPGLHYNWSKSKEAKGVYVVDELDGLRFFYDQLLTGDATDNIPGMYKLFGKKATAVLRDALLSMDNEMLMFRHVLNLYQGNRDVLLRNAELLWIRREAGEVGKYKAPDEEAV